MVGTPDKRLPYPDYLSIDCKEPTANVATGICAASCRYLVIGNFPHSEEKVDIIKLPSAQE